MDRLDWLHDHNECNSMLLYLANNWVGEFSDSSGQKTLDRMNFIKTTRATLAKAKDYRHQREYINIAISPDGTSAQVDSQEVEEGTIDDKPGKLVTVTTDLLEARDGNIVLTKSKTAEMQ